MNSDELKKVLQLHKAYLLGEKEGKLANLSGANLSYANLSGANLYGANLSGADLSCADLSGANLSYTNLRSADLRSANLSGANLYGADLSYANLSYTNLRSADLRSANLSGADLRSANLSGADLSCANLSGANLSGAKYIAPITIAQTTIVPENGPFVGWKKCDGGVLVKVLIVEDAKRSNATGRKCRAEFVKVLEVIGGEIGISQHDMTTTYRVGETVHCDKWEEDRWVECGGGIHFFITKLEAENY